MTRITRRTRGFALSLATLAAGAAVAASPAMAIDPPAVTPSGSAYSFSRSFDFAATPDAGNTVIGYQGGVDVDAPTTPVTPGLTFGGLAIGAHVFRVKAIQQDGVGTVTESTYTEVPFDVLADTVAPTLGATLIGTPTANGWYAALSIGRSPCFDNESGLAPGTCAVTTQWTQNGSFPAGTPVDSVTDLQGNVGTALLAAPLNFDNVKPVAPAPLTPSSGVLVPGEPTFTWNSGSDATSKVATYELQIRILDPQNDTPPITTIASVPANNDANLPRTYSATRQDTVSPDPLPEGKKIEWRVRAIDNAGNITNSLAWFAFTIDSTIPPAPSITDGPTGPTRDTSPSFAWAGTEQTYKWDVRRAGAETPVREGAGPDTQATLSSLPDGDYIFRVTQVTAGGPGKRRGDPHLPDRHHPARPAHDPLAPDLPGDHRPGVHVERRAGRLLALGRHRLQRDARRRADRHPGDQGGAPAAGRRRLQLPGAAGRPRPATSRASRASRSRSSRRCVPAPSPSTRAGTIAALALPKQNASRLQPKPGVVLPTLAPVLRWTKGPRGTKLYNLQIFQVTPGKKAGASPKVTKIYSSFPRGLQMRAPKAKLKAGTCYVWRIWPYTGQAFTPKPVGVSNFCTASSKVIRLKEKQARAKAARAKAARLKAR